MAFGDHKGSLTASSASTGGTNPLTGSVVVAVGDLVFVCFSQQTNLTATGVTDNLGNTYSAVNAGTEAGTVSIRCFYARVTVAGTLDTVTVAASASTNDNSGVASVIEGPFRVGPLDANPANATDGTTPFTCPATGTLSQRNEVVMAAIAIASNQTVVATSPSVITQTVARANVSTGVSRRVVTSTATVSPAFTGTSATAAETTASFEQDPTFAEAIFPDRFPAKVLTAAVMASGLFWSTHTPTPPTIAAVEAPQAILFQRTVLYQSHFWTPFIAEVNSEDKWHQPWSEPQRFKQGLGKHLQQFFTIDPFILTQAERVSEDKWHQPWSEPVRVKPGLGAALQQAHVAFAPNPVVSFGWHEPLSEPVRTREFPTALQQSVAPDPFPRPETLFNANWFVSWSEPARIKIGLRAALQQSAVDDPFNLTQAERVSEDKWHQPWSEPVRTKSGLRPDLQQVFTTDPFPRPEVFSSSWFPPLSEPVRVKLGLGAALQRFDFVDPFILTQAERVSEDKWHQPWSEPVRIKQGLRASLQRTLEFDPFPRPDVGGDAYIGPWSEPNRRVPRPGLQQFFTIDPFLLTQAERVSEDKFHQPWSEPRRFKRGLGSELQQTLALVPQPDVKDQPRWYQPWSEPVRVKVGLSAGAQRFLEFDPFPRPAELTTASWYAPWRDPVRVKPGLKASQQQAPAFFHATPIVSFGWFEPLSEPVRVKARLVTGAQQFLAPTSQPTVSFSWFGPLSEPQRFKSGLGPYLQHYFEWENFPRPQEQGADSWFQHLSDPVRTKRGLKADLQQFFTIDPQLLTQAERVSEDKWHQPWSEPVRFRHLHVSLVQDTTRALRFQVDFLTLVLDATEIGDSMVATLSVRGGDFTEAVVSIVEIVAPRYANVSIVEIEGD